VAIVVAVGAYLSGDADIGSTVTLVFNALFAAFIRNGIANK
jgi:hypothetical protein